MIKAPNSRIQEVYERQMKRLAKMNREAFERVNEVRLNIKNKLSSILESNNLDSELSKQEKYIIEKYMLMFRNLRNDIVESFNQSQLESRYIAEMGAGAEIDWNKIDLRKRLPTKKAFAITNRILNDKSLAIRSKKMAENVTKIVSLGVNKGFGVAKTGRLLDVEFGYRDKTGAINKDKIKLQKKGVISNTNGHLYQTYRIARTESMRMINISNNEAFEELKEKRTDTRLQLIAQIDSRTREQSAQMNGQISNEDGEFLYPDGGWYQLGYAPPEYSINDRETAITIFLDRDKENSQIYSDIHDFLEKSKNRIIK